MTPATATKLTADQARRLHAADVDVARLKAQLAEAELHQKDLRGKYRDRVPLSENAADAAKGVRSCVVAGVTVRIHPMVSAERFSLTGYKAAGHGITAEMREHMSDGTPWDKWTVKDSRGPAHLDRVEPKP